MSPIEKGDRVRVHADGDVIHVDALGMPGSPPRFRVSLQLRENDADKAVGRTRERWQDERTAWFYDDEVEPTLDVPLVTNNGWRDVCADMIRTGTHDTAALALLSENVSTTDDRMTRAAADVIEYIRLLEDLAKAFGRLPTPEVFELAWRLGGGDGGGGSMDPNAAENYEAAATAYQALARTSAYRKDP